MIKLKKDTAYLITKPEHVYYLTNFEGEGFVFLTKDYLLLATDQRYWIQAKQSKAKNIKLFCLKDDWQEDLNKKLSHINIIYFEEDHLTVTGLEKNKKLFPKRKWKKSQQVFKKLRLIKDKDELKKIKKAAAIGDIILKNIKPKLKKGVSEYSILELIRAHTFKLADGPSFEPIVAFGKNAACPHHHSGKTKLKKNDAALIDFGVKYQNYMSDMTRCFFVGKGIPKVQLMYEKLLIVQKAAVNMVRPGVRIKDLVLAVKGLLGKDAKLFTHGLGHGVGLKIHEGPSLSENAAGNLETGMVITIEPGLYKTGVGGVRIEDLLVVTKDGSELLTKSSKNTKL